MKNDGGPAFPQINYWDKDGMKMGASGMSLRDYFATHAPEPPKHWMDCYTTDRDSLNAFADVVTQWNYAYADSMLRAKEKS